MLEAGKGGAQRLDARAFARRFANPNIITACSVLALAFSGARIPNGAVATLSAIGAAATPICMVCLGAMFYFADRRALLDARELAAGVGVKILVLPLIGGLALSCSPLTVQSQGGPGEYASVL